MFGTVLIFVLKELAPAIRKLIAGVREGNAEKRKEAIVELETAAEKAAIKRVRGG